MKPALHSVALSKTYPEMKLKVFESLCVGAKIAKIRRRIKSFRVWIPYLKFSSPNPWFEDPQSDDLLRNIKHHFRANTCAVRVVLNEGETETITHK